MPSTRNIKPDLSIRGLTTSSQTFAVATPPLNSCGVPQIPAFGQYYVYASGPKVSSQDRPRNKESKESAIPRAHQDYHNMMWDPRIYRGATYKTYKKAEQERCKKHSMEQLSNQRKKGIKQSQTKLGGINRPKTPPHHTADKIGLEDMGMQTEKYLEEITDEVKERDMCTQTDHVFDLNIAPLFCPIKLGVDASTQIEPWELFQFDEEAKPIITTLVGKIIEQALFETMEEIELDSLREQQSIYEEHNREHLMRLQRLYDRERNVTEERARLIQERLMEVRDETDAEARVGATLFSVNYLAGMANDVLNDLRRDGHMSENDGLDESFIPWLHNRSIWQFCKRAAGSTLLDDIIKHVVDNREADVADGIWREISAQNQLYHMQPESGITYLSAMSDEYDEEEE